MRRYLTGTRWLAWAVLAASLLAACSDTGRGASQAVDPRDLCVESSCGERVVLLPVPDAENLHFTPEGRLFVSGGTGVFEVHEAETGLVAVAINDAPCNFTGLAQRGDVLYANCFDGRLFAARLDAVPALQPIHDLDLPTPNGLATGPDGALYLTNGPIDVGLTIPDPKIVRVAFDAADPFSVVEQTDWLSSGLTAPNGLTVRGRDFFITDSSIIPLALGRVLRVPFEDDGNPGEVEEVVRFLSLLDDLSVVGDHLLVTLFTQEAIALVGPDGDVVQRTNPLSLNFPSAVMVGQPPLFAADDILVTEKGLLGETGSQFGNQLSVFRRSE